MAFLIKYLIIFLLFYFQAQKKELRQLRQSSKRGRWKGQLLEKGRQPNRKTARKYIKALIKRGINKRKEPSMLEKGLINIATIARITIFTKNNRSARVFNMIIRIIYKTLRLTPDIILE
jgi:hypothetical protein